MSIINLKNDSKYEKLLTFIIGILVGIILISILFFFIGPKHGNGKPGGMSNMQKLFNKMSNGGNRNSQNQNGSYNQRNNFGN